MPDSPASSERFARARQLRAAGAAIALAASLVLAGAALDITAATSFVAGWRVMVPSTALCFALLGLATFISASHRDRAGAVLSILLAAVVATVALVTLAEYASGQRFLLETWGGLWEFGPAPYAGRMSPMTAFVLLTLAVGQGAAAMRRYAARTIARVAAGTALFASWLAVLALAVDVGRLANEPRFPGMAAPTLAFIIATSTALLALTTLAHPTLSRPEPRLRWPIWSVIAAFVAPPLFSLLHRIALDTGRIEGQLLAATIAMGFSLVLTMTVWRYASRLAAADRAQARVQAELEARVAERTRALTTSNDELQRHQDALRDADRRKDEFLALLAHELRNPLAPIRTAARIVGAGHATGEQRQHAAVIIDRQVAVMRRLIDDLLDISRITAGKLQMRPEPVALADVMEFAVATIQPLCDERGQLLSVSLPDAPIHLEADAARLTQAFGNLLHNASKFTSPGGHISIAARRDASGMAEVTVKDDGEGIDPEFLPRLFDKFSQAERGVGPMQGGLGLGLAVVQGIVSLHGGVVTARSDGAKTGSTFTVRLPILEGVPQPALASAASPVASRRCRILVVDDNQDNAESLAELLCLEGHSVRTAFDSAEAFARMKTADVDVMLIDLGLPGMDGLELCRRIRATPRGRDMLIIAQTGFGLARDVERTREAGFDGHLTKPIAIEELRRLLPRDTAGVAS